MSSEEYKIKVGIPRAFHYYRYFPFWKKLFDEFGVEIILSPGTNKKIVQEGVSYALGDLCLPLKVYYGHVLKLIEKHPELDYLFVPRYVSEVPDSYFCPKFLSLPDVIKIVPNVPPILHFEVNVKKKPISMSVIDMAKELGIGQRKALDAYYKADEYFNKYVSFLRSGAPVNYALRLVKNNKAFKLPKKKQKSGEIKLLLLGHEYNIFDTYVNLDFQEKLREENVEVITKENLPQKVFQTPVVVNKKLKNYWRHEEEIMQAIRYFLTKGRDEIDGVIFLISFACGPDSIISELIMRDMKVVRLPFLQIIMDEHTGEAGLLTRVQSFTDMIKRKKKKLKMREKEQQTTSSQKAEVI
ncbi:MAG: acyl-CoA dehydratase activase-related protein [Promethearchaeia archaeon]